MGRVGFLLLALLLPASCSDDPGSDPMDASAPGDTGTSGPVYVGGDRPARVVVPDAEGPLPLVILLHGYSISGVIQDAYFRTTPRAHEMGFILVFPDGTFDPSGNRFWSALPEFEGIAAVTDDVAYLLSLVDEVSAGWDVDPSRIYFVGHSNGAFMAHRMACDAADRVAAIVSLAGSTFADPADCVASEPVSVLSIHGDIDDRIPYEGTPEYPGAVALAERWAARGGCDPATPSAGAPVDFDGAIAGAETTVSRYDTGCEPGVSVQLWTIAGGGHLPAVTDEGIDAALAWALAQRR